MLEIDIGDNKIILKGGINFKENRRLRLSFNRFEYKEEDDILYFLIKNKNEIIKKIEELQDILRNNKINFALSKKVNSKLSSYNRELENFKLFSKKARQIRNSEFLNNPELLENYRLFKRNIEEKMTRKMYALQELSSFYMAFSQNSCNFSVPGAGKTTIVYGAYSFLSGLSKEDKKYVDKILIIGPLSSFRAWENEYYECFGKKVEAKRLSGNDYCIRDKKLYFYSNPKEITLISHASMKSLKEDIVFFLKHNNVMVVVDEAHRIKNINGEWGKSSIDIAKEAKSRIILTGTPAPNGYEDLYNLYQFIYPFKFKEILNIHYDQLRELTRSKVLEGNERVDNFINNITPYFIRIKKDDLKLPEIREKNFEIEMDDIQKEIYDFIEDDYVKFFERQDVRNLKNILTKARLIRLRQAAVNPSLLLKSLKESLEDYSYEEGDSNLNSIVDLDSIEDKELFFENTDIFNKISSYKDTIPAKFVKVREIIEKISNEKIIIWTIFIQNAEKLSQYLKDNNIESRLLIGKVPMEEREEIIDKFNKKENNEFRVVIANPFAVAESISLHKGCHNAIYLERDFNCATFVQSKDRIHRYGLSKDIETNYYYLLSKNTIDLIIDERLSLKERRMSAILEKDIPLFSCVDNDEEKDIIKRIIDFHNEKIIMKNNEEYVFRQNKEIL